MFLFERENQTVTVELRYKLLAGVLFCVSFAVNVLKHRMHSVWGFQGMWVSALTAGSLQFKLRVCINSWVSLISAGSLHYQLGVPNFSWELALTVGCP